MVWMFEYRCFFEDYAPSGPMELENFSSFLNEWDWRRFRFATHDGAPIRGLS